jgi:hypothetical protein
LRRSDLGRKAKIPVYVGAMFDYHWNDHARQIAKIRKANGLLAV